MSLSSKQIRHLRALAHHLKPVVQVGNAGITSAVIAKTDTELTHHELIKVRLLDADRQDLADGATALCGATRSELVQTIGKLLVLYRQREEDPSIVLPES